MASSLPRGETIIAEGHVAAALPIALIGSSLSTNETELGISLGQISDDR